MDLNDIKRGLRAEIKKRENEQYLTFQCNVRQMCKDVLAKLEEQESEIEELKHQRDGAFGLTNLGLTLDDLSQMARKQIDRQKFKRCLAMAKWCDAMKSYFNESGFFDVYANERMVFYERWLNRWLKIAEQFKDKEAK